MTETATHHDYVDIRDIHPDWSWFECWNCGNRERVGPNRHIRMCHQCFMSQTQHDHETSSTTDDGYLDYRKLWYGDIPLEDARRRYRERTSDIRERFERMDARDRAVRL